MSDSKSLEQRSKIPLYLTDIENIFRFDFKLRDDFNSSGGIVHHLNKSIQFIRTCDAYDEEERDELIKLLEDEISTLKFAENSKNLLIRLS